MTAIPEITTAKPAQLQDISATTESLTQRQLPHMGWPMNIGVLLSPLTQIFHSRSEEGPGVTIRTPPDSAFSVRAPLSGRMLQVKQTDNRSTVIIKPVDSLLVVLGNLQDVTIRPQELKENELTDPEYTMPVKAGEIIGSYGSNTLGLTLQIAHLSHNTTTGFSSWELLDPREILPPLQ